MIGGVRILPLRESRCDAKVAAIAGESPMFLDRFLEGTGHLFLVLLVFLYLFFFNLTLPIGFFLDL